MTGRKEEERERRERRKVSRLVCLSPSVCTVDYCTVDESNKGKRTRQKVECRLTFEKVAKGISLNSSGKNLIFGCESAEVSIFCGPQCWSCSGKLGKLNDAIFGR